jgi:hypothetical protein
MAHNQEGTMRIAILSVLFVILAQGAALAGCIYPEWCYCRGAASSAHVKVVERSGATASAEVLAVTGGSPLSVGERITIDEEPLGSAIFAVVLFFEPVQRVVADGALDSAGAVEVDPVVLPITGSGTVYCSTQPAFSSSPAEVLRVSVLETQACVRELAEAGFTPPECNDTDFSGPDGCRAASGRGGHGPLLALLLLAALMHMGSRRAPEVCGTCVRGPDSGS